MCSWKKMVRSLDNCIQIGRMVAKIPFYVKSQSILENPFLFYFPSWELAAKLLQGWILMEFKNQVVGLRWQ